MTPRLLIVILLVAAAGGGLWMLLDPGTTNAPGGGIVEEAPADVPEHGATLEGDQRTTPQPGASNSPASETPPPRPGSREALAAQEARAAKEVPAPLEKVLAKVRVLLPDGRPAIGTHVMLRSRDGTTVFEGTVSGATFILDVPPGRYELIARGPDSTWLHDKSFFVTGTGSGDAPELPLKSVPELQVRIVHASSTEGQEPQGEAHAEVMALHWNPPAADFDAIRKRAVHVGTTDASGHVGLGPAEVGTYVLLARRANGAELRTTYRHPSAAGAVIRIQATRQVPLTVIEKIGRGPIPGARIRVMGRGGGRIDALETVWVTADRSGRVLIPLTAKGGPQLEVEADGYLAWPPGLGRERREAEAAVRNPLWRWREGMDVPVVELTAGPSGPWRIRVQTADGAAVAGVPVSFWRHDFSGRRLPELELTTDAEGLVVLERVPNLGYRADVATAEWQSPRFVHVDPRVPMDPDKPLLLQIEPRYSAYGRVLHADGRAAVGARVWIGYSHPSESVRPADEALFKETFTGADGRWRLAGLHSHAAYLFNAQWNGFRADPITSPIHKGEMPLDLVLKPAITLRIHVRELGSGNDVPGATVTLRPKPIYNTPPRRYTANAEGVVQVQGLMPGAWEVLPASAMHLTAEWTLLELAGQSGVIEHTLSLDPGFAIAGRVEDAMGLPVKAAVSLSGQRDDPPGRSISRRVETDTEGNFRITGLVPGQYKILAFIDGTRRRARTDWLTGGETNVVIVLK